jgi:hypothetical protein
MKNEKLITDHLPDTNEEDFRREEDLKAAAKRRDAYSLIRDVQANEFNKAITKRLEKEKLEQEHKQEQEQEQEQEESQELD